mmetsp:Transcript_11378/g.23015  ORF Transcript_11378/g.23015 Transcript_11378/m.23015 type:complete len:97 (+) Transcript_11378:184-474(+)
MNDKIWMCWVTIQLDCCRATNHPVSSDWVTSVSNLIFRFASTIGDLNKDSNGSIDCIANVVSSSLQLNNISGLEVNKVWISEAFLFHLASRIDNII